MPDPGKVQVHKSRNKVRKPGMIPKGDSRCRLLGGRLRGLAPSLHQSHTVSTSALWKHCILTFCAHTALGFSCWSERTEWVLNLLPMKALWLCVPEKQQKQSNRKAPSWWQLSAFWAAPPLPAMLGRPLSAPCCFLQGQPACAWERTVLYIARPPRTRPQNTHFRFSHLTYIPPPHLPSFLHHNFVYYVNLLQYKQKIQKCNI